MLPSLTRGCLRVSEHRGCTEDAHKNQARLRWLPAGLINLLYCIASGIFFLCELLQPFNITDVGHSFKRVAFAISRSSSVGSTSGYKLETCEWHCLFCASCFRLRMNVVWDALSRRVPRCRAAVLSRAFRAAFRAAALSARFSALSVPTFCLGPMEKQWIWYL